MMFKELLFNVSYTQVNMYYAMKTEQNQLPREAVINKVHPIVQITYAQYKLSLVPCAVNKTSYPSKSSLPDNLLLNFHVCLVSAPPLGLSLLCF